MSLPCRSLRRNGFRGLLYACFLCSSAWAQQSPMRNQGGLDAEIPVPVAMQIPSSNPAALAELQAYAKTIGATLWQGMHASGSMVDGSAPDALPAVLDMLPGNRSRLAVQTKQGESVTVTNGDRGYLHLAGEQASKLSSNAVLASISSFDLPSRVVLNPGGYGVVDLGTVTLGDHPFHKIRIQEDILNPDPVEGLERVSALDLYFDSSTHLLYKTAAAITLPGAGRHRFLRVLTYTDYKPSNSLLVPTAISETLDGRATWTLQLTTIDTSSLPSPAEF